MDDTRFDAWVRVFAGSLTRRGVLAALVGAAGLHASAADGKPRRRRHRRRSRRDRVSAERQERVTLCHRRGNDTVHAITVAQSAVRAHLAHGDVIRTDCCTTAECQGSELCADGRCCTPPTPSEIFELCRVACTCGEISDGCGGTINCADQPICPPGLVCQEFVPGADIRCCDELGCPVGIVCGGPGGGNCGGAGQPPCCGGPGQPPCGPCGVPGQPPCGGGGGDGGDGGGDGGDGGTVGP
jgi:hypothetical protein